MFARAALLAGLLLATKTRAVEVTGRVLGHDGRPLPRAMVILRDGSGGNLASDYAAPDGTFRVKADHAGLLRVQLIGAFHENQDVYVLTRTSDGNPISIEARLQAHEYHTNPNVRLSAYGQPAIDQKPFVRQPDGTWLLEFDYPNDELLAGISGMATTKAIAIPDAGEYRRRFNTMLTALRPTNGRIRIVFDPTKLPRSDRPSSVSFGTGQAIRTQVHEVCTSVRKMLDAQEQRRWAVRKGGAVPPTPSLGALAELFGDASRETHPLLRDGKWLLYLVQAIHQENDLSRIRHALKELKPTSPFWEMAFGAAAQAAGKAGNVDYLFALMAVLPHAPLKVTAYQQLLRDGVPAMRPRLLERMREEFPNEWQTKAAIADYEPASQIRVGQSAPRFSITSLSAPETVYSSDSLSAKFTLIDFWATWCAPCVVEMPSLHRVYDEYRGKGFEILSVSLDESRDVVRQFRAARFPMPWLNAIDADLKGFDSRMSKDFGVYGVPRAFLVDRNGKIVAMDADLRGDKLQKTIARLSADNP